MENFLQAMRHLGVTEALQAVVAFLMSVLVHLCSESVMGGIASVLAVVVLMFNVRLGYTKNRTARIEEKTAELKYRKESR